MDRNIYKVSRQLKKTEHSLYNALRSIYHDALFVSEIAHLWPRLPLLANLRCGLWYAHPDQFHGTAYFKSTDGHNGNWSFNVTRLNLHVALLAGTLTLISVDLYFCFIPVAVQFSHRCRPVLYHPRRILCKEHPFARPVHA